MNNFFENLKRVSQDIKLDASRKAQFRNELITYMNTHPVQKHERVKSVLIFRNVFSYFKIHRTAPVALVACAVLILGAGTSYAAEGSLPGDILYPIKVSVNEEVRAALIFDEDDKVDFEISRAETRLAEADELAATGKLNDEAQTKVESNLSKNSDRVQRRIKLLETAGETEKAADLASHFEASLQAHADVLTVISSEPEDKPKQDKEGLSKFRKNVDTKANVLIKQRQDLNDKIVSNDDQDRVKASASGKLRAAQNTISEVKKYIEAKSKDGQNSTKAASEQLKLAQDLLTQSKIKLEVGEYALSFDMSSKAQRQALSAKALVKVEVRLPERIKKELPSTIERNSRDRDDREDNSTNNRVPSSNGQTPRIPTLPKLNF